MSHDDRNSYVHRVKQHKWVNGRLNVTEHIFKNEKDAVHFSQTSEGLIKVYNCDDELVHQSQISMPPSVYG